MRLDFLVILLFLSLITMNSFSQTRGSITVHGDIDKYYPVTWLDGNWYRNEPTTLKIVRPDVHENSSWRGTLLSEFIFHTSQWGHLSNFINTHITCAYGEFVAGWRDITLNNDKLRIIIWLRGGGTTYHYTADTDVNPIVYDNVQNPLPYNEVNEPAHSLKTSIDSYVNSFGESNTLNAYFNGEGTSHFKGSLGIGTTDTKGHKLAVAGSIVAESVKVNLRSSWPDYVFDENFGLMPLAETGEFIQKHGHLPEIPSAAEVKKNGIDIGEINVKLLKKIEELTLHLIALRKEVDELKANK
ncbi:hypothetical protein B0I27_11619 [Arcticibacter pallidicorallinus]|uniref:Tail fiber domain-containing protein n=1 Tax=Arcticibacter pallidicorallinus TaxID=1259464 RepID=A0A2T0TQX8_9SPHI|nr:hypothetical protein [Arcticibacter pallidicorallinus]PRY48085.1 hypothetical protein B0I27_11619 [Arcticibacter pallidicorallinus]